LESNNEVDSKVKLAAIQLVQQMAIAWRLNNQEGRRITIWISIAKIKIDSSQ
jgi:hypothetical protein